MKMVRYALLNMKRGIKNKAVLGLSFVMPLLVITIIYFVAFRDAGSTFNDVALNILDQGTYTEDMLKELDLKCTKYYNMEDKALESLKKNDIKAVYTIPKDFTDKIKSGVKPEITAYKNVEGNYTSPFESVLEEWISSKVKYAILINEGIINSKSDIPKATIGIDVKGPEKALSMGQFFTILMIINFMIFSANAIGMELLSFKKQKILSRAITTANKGYEIIGGIYLGSVLLQIVVYTAVYLIEKQIIGFSLDNFLLVFVNIILLSLVSTSLGIMVVRIFEHESMVSLTVNLIGIATTFLGMAGMNITSNQSSWVVQNLSKFTPQYWVMNSIDTSTLFPNLFIVLLMALVLFTAGNYKVRSFINR